MGNSQDSDLDSLVARLADGDRSAFAGVFRILWPSTLRLCMTLLKNEADASDAAQQALEKILIRSVEYDHARPAMPWALGIAAWECRTILRRRGRLREVPGDLVPERSYDQEEQFARHELVARAIEVIGDLSNEDRETLVATFWDEAASVSGAVLRKRRERALKRLRHAFRRLYGLD